MNKTDPPKYVPPLWGDTFWGVSFGIESGSHFGSALCSSVSRICVEAAAVVCCFIVSSLCWCALGVGNSNLNLLLGKIYWQGKMIANSAMEMHYVWGMVLWCGACVHDKCTSTKCNVGNELLLIYVEVCQHWIWDGCDVHWDTGIGFNVYPGECMGSEIKARHWYFCSQCFWQRASCRDRLPLYIMTWPLDGADFHNHFIFEEKGPPASSGFPYTHTWLLYQRSYTFLFWNRPPALSGLLCLIHGLRRRPASNYLNTDTSQGLLLRRVSLAETQTGFQCTLASKILLRISPGLPHCRASQLKTRTCFADFLAVWRLSECRATRYIELPLCFRSCKQSWVGCDHMSLSACICFDDIFHCSTRTQSWCRGTFFEDACKHCCNVAQYPSAFKTWLTVVAHGDQHEMMNFILVCVQ